MPRLILIIVLIWVVIVVLKRLVSTNSGTKPGQTRQEERIVRCAQCGLHVPESESAILDGRVLCNNPQCRKQHS